MQIGVESVMKDLYAVKIRAIWVELKNERAPFLLLCTYLFLEYVRPQSIYPEIDVIPYALVTVVLTLAMYFYQSERPQVKNVENKLLGLYFLVVLLSSIFAYLPNVAFAKIQDFGAWLVIYYLITHIVNTEKRFFIFFLSFLLYNFKMSQHGFISWAQIGFQFRSWGVTGSPGWFHNSGEFGIELCIFLPLSIYFIIALKPYWGKLKLLFFLLFPFTAIMSVIATSSRGALIGSSAALLWMLVKSKARVKGLLAISIIAIAVYSYLPPEQHQRFQSSGDDKTSVTRLVRWKAGLEIMDQHPFLGVGYANWMSYYGDFYTKNRVGLPHNIFLDAGAELGYTGLVIFILMIVYTLVNNNRTRKLALTLDNKFIFYTAHGLDAALIGFLVSGFFVSVLYYPYFWINLSLTVALNNIVNQQAEKRSEIIKSED